MAEVTIELVKKLRDMTGVSIMQCKKALIEADGDLEKAKIALTKKSGEIAAKKGDRELGAGTIVIEEKDGKTIILELACETDFVGKNQDFIALAKEIAQDILEGREVEEKINEGIQKFGERIELVRKEIFESPNIGKYVHNNLIGAVVEFDKEVDEAFAKDIAMHVAAQNPKYIKKDDIDPVEKEKATETLREEVLDKPAEMQDKILEGKLNAYFKERVLETQSFIKDPNKSVGQLLDEKGVQVVKFTRFGVGEA